ncbi:protein CHLOROPLAST IMPORT APPARATUS 2-like isoform X2 [Senna tora]|uniref:Protein CHLOROPLAST IMPORT APPARATUS 2-like isoform X2 n=1 Tax=Senna tora TaxID=362788 RepID=A0A835CDZ8_9FABA|nr:protein CHLOROPLAST IMPORT APPARATUS 2-like isoform X2 [Senna tora]
MSACLSGASGGRTYGFDFDFVKSPTSLSSTPTSHTSSPSSTISESSDSPLAISTRKPRTPRKRPNQTYNEAAAMLSTAYPNLFPTDTLKKPPPKFITRPTDTNSNWDESSQLILPFPVFFDTPSFLLQHKPSDFPMEPKAVNILQEKPCQSPGEISSHNTTTMEFHDDCQLQDFDAESILDEEIGEGIDSIMGSCRAEDSNGASCHGERVNPWINNEDSIGGKFDFRIRALRRVDEGYWWNFPAVVDMLEISPKIEKPPALEKKKKTKTKTKKVDKLTPTPMSVEPKNTELPRESSIPKSSNPGLLLKLNYNGVLNAWSDRGSPFAGETPGSDVPGNDVTARLAQIDLFSDNGGVMREASVLRYKEKRRTRLFSNSKKIRYQVRKVNADTRPRLKV